MAPSLVMKLFITENIRIFISGGGFQKLDLHYNNIGQVFSSLHFTDIILVAMWPVWLGATWFFSWKYFSALFSVSAWQVGSVSVSHSLLAFTAQLQL